MLILGIETSCDDTAVALYQSEIGIIAHQIHSQIDIHREYGGVVPELASRDHIRRTLPLIQKTIEQANISATDIQGIAYTKGPGLVGALMVGASLAKSLAFGWKIPALGLHHMESHLMAVMLEEPAPSFPFLALLVSGGHTLLVEVKKLGNYKVLGESLDDAAGEAFDKIAKLLGLENPNGATLAKLAEKGDPQRFSFPRPMLDRPGLDFSFSGLKTAVSVCFQNQSQDEQTRADIAVAFENAVIETLMLKCKRALKETQLNSLAIVGGVASNQKLREKLNTLMLDRGGKIFYPRPAYCTDNGAMVAYNGWLHFMRGDKENLAIEVKPRWPMQELC